MSGWPSGLRRQTQGVSFLLIVGECSGPHVRAWVRIPLLTLFCYEQLCVSCIILGSLFGTTSSRFYGVMVSTLDSESSDPSSNLGRTFFFLVTQDCSRWKILSPNNNPKLEIPGIEPETSHMRIVRSTTELHPRLSIKCGTKLQQCNARDNA